MVSIKSEVQTFFALFPFGSVIKESCSSFKNSSVTIKAP